MRLRAGIVLAVVVLSTWVTARANVVSSGPGGFTVREEAEYPGTPAAAWQRLVHPADWWSSKHTYSGDAAHMTLSLEPGGCWCETLPNGGFVRHMEVAYAAPGVALRLVGGLGPLQAMGASGALTFKLSAAEGGKTKVVAEYTGAGYAADGFAQLAVAVDRVLAEQLKRFAGAP
jgi:hypothetical protein